MRDEVVASMEITRFVPTEDQYAWTFGGYDPVLRVRPGQVSISSLRTPSAETSDQS